MYCNHDLGERLTYFEKKETEILIKSCDNSTELDVVFHTLIMIRCGYVHVMSNSVVCHVSGVTFRVASF